MAVAKERVQDAVRRVNNLSRTDISNLIDEWIVGRNAERNRSVLKRRLIDGITYERLAEEFDMSVRQIKNVVYKSERRLFMHIDM